MDVVTGVAVDFARRCEYRNRTVCPPYGSLPAHYPDGYFQPHLHAHHCREEVRSTCFQVQSVRGLYLESIEIWYLFCQHFKENQKKKKTILQVMFDFVTLSCATNILTELNVNWRKREMHSG